MNTAAGCGLLEVLVNFGMVFTGPSYANFVRLTLGWILASGRHTISRTVRLVRGDTHHSVFYRFFTRAVWRLDTFSFVLFRLALALIPSQTVTALVDDTLCRRSGPKIWGGGMHHDAVLSSYGRGLTQRVVTLSFGHSWVVVSLFVPLPWNPARGLALPILFRLYRSKRQCPAEEYRKRSELAVELLTRLIAWLPSERALLIAGDREYACRTVVRALPPDVHFVGPMCMNAAVFAPPQPSKGRGRPAKKGPRLPSPEQLARDETVPWESRTVRIYGREVQILIKAQSCLWYTVAGTRLGRMVLTRDPSGRIEERAYFSTHHEVSAELILETYARRWAAEVMHRDTKQLMGLDEPQNGWWRRGRGRGKKKPGPDAHPTLGKNAAQRTAPFIFAVYATVIAWYLSRARHQEDVQRARRVAPWYVQKKEPSFGDMLGAARREILRSIIRAPAERLGIPKNPVALLEALFDP